MRGELTVESVGPGGFGQRLLEGIRACLEMPWLPGSPEVRRTEQPETFCRISSSPWTWTWGLRSFGETVERR